jgi:DNA-binding CsgD family transcriptional regulator
MTPAERASVKKAYFDLLDLIIKYRIHEPLGKLGLTRMPKSEVSAIPDLKFNKSFEVLYNDKIIGILKKDKKELLYDIVMQDRLEIIIVDCLKSAEEMTAYKNSLIVETGWPSVRVDSLGDEGSSRYEMRRRNGSGRMVELSNKEGVLLTFLLTENNLDKSREEVAAALHLTGARVSNFKNSLKRKLKTLGFTAEETSVMMRTYQR